MNIKASDLERLLEVSTLLTSTLDLDSLLTKVLEMAETLMEAEASNVMLLDRSKNELVYEIVLGNAGTKIKEQKRLKVGVGIAGWVAEHELPLLVEDAYEDPRFFNEFDKKTGFHTKSILCLPLQVRGTLIGIAQIINKKNASTFTAADQELFSKFSSIAAVAIDNALLHRQILEQDRFKRDMQLAEEIQKTFLPSDIPRVKNIRIAYRSIPCRQVGGDIMQISQLPDGKMAVFVADVSGKGVPAALFGARVLSDYEYELSSNPDGGALFSKLNSIVARRSTRGMFITAVYGVLDPQSGKLHLVNAGHIIPSIVGPHTGEQRLAKTAEFPPLGVVEEQIFRTTEIQLAPGEHLIFMTDGVTEAKSSDGSRLGPDTVLESIASCPSNAVARLMATVKQFTHGEPLADDITLMGVRFGPYEELRITSDSSELASVRLFADEYTKKVGFQDKQRGRISLAITEAITNIMKHTYQMSKSHEISIEFEFIDQKLQIHIRDWGPKQDPTKFSSRSLDEVRPGGLGIHYMKESMEVIEFDDSLMEGNEVFMTAHLHKQ